MLSRSRWMVSAVVGLSVLLHVVAIEAQQQRIMQQQQQQRSKPQPYTGKGTIDAMGPGWLKMTSGTDSVAVQFSRSSNVRVLGTAQPEFLKRGQLVQFNATFDKNPKPEKSTASDKKAATHIEVEVKKLTICAEGPEFTPGCIPETGAGADSAATSAGAGAGITPAKPARKSRGVAKEDPGPHPYIVTGNITHVNKKDSITVHVNGVKRPVDVTIAEGTQLDVNIADLSQVKQGDNLEVIQGQGMKLPAGGMMVMATEAHITLSAPLTGAAKKGRAKAGHGKKTDDSAASAFPGAAKPDAKDAKPKDDK